MTDIGISGLRSADKVGTERAIPEWLAPGSTARWPHIR